MNRPRETHSLICEEQQPNADLQNDDGVDVQQKRSQCTEIDRDYAVLVANTRPLVGEDDYRNEDELNLRHWLSGDEQAAHGHMSASLSGGGGLSIQAGSSQGRKDVLHNQQPPPPPVIGGLIPYKCFACGRPFDTMSSHPERGWRGARPPPTFRAEEELADMALNNSPVAAEEEENFSLPDLNLLPDLEDEEENFDLPNLNLLPDPEEDH